MKTHPPATGSWPPGPNPPEQAGDRAWAALAHAGPVAGYFLLFGHIFLPALILAVRGRESPFVRENARRALNFQISITLYAIAGVILFGVGRLLRPVMMVMRGNAMLHSPGDVSHMALQQVGVMAGFMALGFFIAGAFLLFNLICVITATARASQGETFRYPLAIPFVR